MTDKPENPSAFPVPWPDASPSLGMTLRDYFAGQALAGLCANPGGDCDAETMANVSYSLADAMLKARVKND